MENIVINYICNLLITYSSYRAYTTRQMLSKNFSRLIATSITKYHAVTVCNNDAKMIKKKKKRIR